MRFILIILFIGFFSGIVLGQAVPAIEENIPFLVTFGKEAPKGWGDDDYNQTFFYVVPKEFTQPFYIRIYDPDCGGTHDEKKEDFDSKTKFSVYGGKECYTNKDARKTEPIGNFKSGNLLASKIFGKISDYDNNWYSFGPFNPSEGEYVESFTGYIFKIIAEGITGNDGNLYRYYFSTASEKNVIVEGGNAFTYEYTFRLSDQPRHVSHIYPFIDDKVVSIKIHNFDWDNDGYIRLITNSKNGKLCKLSAEGDWKFTEFQVVEEEKNSTFDVQFVKPAEKAAKNNNGVLYVTNQYNEFLPFFTTPLGGIPKYKYKIRIKK